MIGAYGPVFLLVAVFWFNFYLSLEVSATTQILHDQSLAGTTNIVIAPTDTLISIRGCTFSGPLNLEATGGAAGWELASGIEIIVENNDAGSNPIRLTQWTFLTLHSAVVLFSNNQASEISIGRWADVQLRSTNISITNNQVTTVYFSHTSGGSPAKLTAIDSKIHIRGNSLHELWTLWAAGGTITETFIRSHYFIVDNTFTHVLRIGAITGAATGSLTVTDGSSISAIGNKLLTGKVIYFGFSSGSTGPWSVLLSNHSSVIINHNTAGMLWMAETQADINLDFTVSQYSSIDISENNFDADGINFGAASNGNGVALVRIQESSRVLFYGNSVSGSFLYIARSRNAGRVSLEFSQRSSLSVRNNVLTKEVYLGGSFTTSGTTVGAKSEFSFSDCSLLTFSDNSMPLTSLNVAYADDGGVSLFRAAGGGSIHIEENTMDYMTFGNAATGNAMSMISLAAIRPVNIVDNVLTSGLYLSSCEAGGNNACSLSVTANSLLQVEGNTIASGNLDLASTASSSAASPNTNLTVFDSTVSFRSNKAILFRIGYSWAAGAHLLMDVTKSALLLHGNEVQQSLSFLYTSSGGSLDAHLGSGTNISIVGNKVMTDLHFAYSYQAGSMLNLWTTDSVTALEKNTVDGSLMFGYSNQGSNTVINFVRGPILISDNAAESIYWGTSVDVGTTTASLSLSDSSHLQILRNTLKSSIIVGYAQAAGATVSMVIESGSELVMNLNVCGPSGSLRFLFSSGAGAVSVTMSSSPRVSISENNVGQDLTYSYSEQASSSTTLLHSAAMGGSASTLVFTQNIVGGSLMLGVTSDSSSTVSTSLDGSTSGGGGSGSLTVSCKQNKCLGAIMVGSSSSSSSSNHWTASSVDLMVTNNIAYSGFQFLKSISNEVVSSMSGNSFVNVVENSFGGSFSLAATGALSKDYYWKVFGNNLTEATSVELDAWKLTRVVFDNNFLRHPSNVFSFTANSLSAATPVSSISRIFGCNWYSTTKEVVETSLVANFTKYSECKFSKTSTFQTIPTSSATVTNFDDISGTKILGRTHTPTLSPSQIPSDNSLFVSSRERSSEASGLVVSPTTYSSLQSSSSPYTANTNSDSDMVIASFSPATRVPPSAQLVRQGASPIFSFSSPNAPCIDALLLSWILFVALMIGLFVAQKVLTSGEDDTHPVTDPKTQWFFAPTGRVLLQKMIWVQVILPCHGDCALLHGVSLFSHVLTLLWMSAATLLSISETSTPSLPRTSIVFSAVLSVLLALPLRFVFSFFLNAFRREDLLVERRTVLGDNGGVEMVSSFSDDGGKSSSRSFITSSGLPAIRPNSSSSSINVASLSPRGKVDTSGGANLDHLDNIQVEVDDQLNDSLSFDDSDSNGDEEKEAEAEARGKGPMSTENSKLKRLPAANGTLGNLKKVEDGVREEDLEDDTVVLASSDISQEKPSVGSKRMEKSSDGRKDDPLAITASSEGISGREVFKVVASPQRRQGFLICGIYILLTTVLCICLGVGFDVSTEACSHYHSSIVPLAIVVDFMIQPFTLGVWILFHWITGEREGDGDDDDSDDGGSRDWFWFIPHQLHPRDCEIVVS